MKKHLLFLFAALLPMLASAEKVEIDGIWYNLVSKAKQAEVTYKGNSYNSYDEYSGSITIPATVTYDGVAYSVTSIGERAFRDCRSLTAITIPEGVTSIGSDAFYDCLSLTAINIPENSKLTSIGICAFFDCGSLTAITLPESVTSIGDGAFECCLSLKSINIPEGVTSIGRGAFSYCSSLTAITIPEGVTSIGESAFAWCSSLTAITLPEGVTSIGSYAFECCLSLTAITIPEGVTSIERDAFFNCSSLTAITLPEDVTSIGYGAFSGCSSLTAINIPEGVTSIGDAAFWYCSSLTAINIPEGVTSIGKEAFSYCSSLTAINIPEGVTSIGHQAFYNCISLAAINIPEGVTRIGHQAFYNCISLAAINIPEGVTRIEYGAFWGCSSLTAINIPEGVTSIEDYAFSGCSKLTAIVLPKSVSSIYSEAFADCGEVLDVYCHAETVPTTEADAFEESYPGKATLHVPASAINDYKTTAPWSSFGTIVSLTEEKVTSITLSHTEATLTEGQTLTLIATVEPGYATDKTITWSSSDSNVASVDDKGKVTAIAPGTATIIAKANDGSGVSAQCVVTVEAATYVSITINQYGSGTYCSQHALDFSNVEGLKAYAAAGYNSITGVVTLLRLNTSQPGEGLFIKGEPGKYMVPVMVSTGDHTTNMLVGTLTETAVNATSGDGLYANYKYTIKKSDSQPLFYQLTDGSTLGAGKAYLQIPMAWLPQTSEAKSISLRFEEGEGTTDIENSQFTIDNSQLIFDLYGRRVDNPVKGGIYIVGGKKVVM